MKTKRMTENTLAKQQPEKTTRKNKTHKHTTYYFKIVWSGFGQGTGHFFLKCYFHTLNNFYVWFYWWMGCIMLHILRTHLAGTYNLRICRRSQIPSFGIVFSLYSSLTLSHSSYFFSIQLCVCVRSLFRIDSSVSRHTRQYRKTVVHSLKRHCESARVKEWLSNERALQAKQNELFVNNETFEPECQAAVKTKIIATTTTTARSTHMLIVISIEYKHQTNAGIFVCDVRWN